MGDVTGIGWTDATFNPWWGCSRISPGCRFCYADRDASRWGHRDLWRRHGDRRMLSDRHWARPLVWNRDCQRAGTRKLVFCASMADVFEDHPQVVDARARLWDLIEQTPALTWQLLTKRIENAAGMVPWTGAWPSNVWIGTSVENAVFAPNRIGHLLKLDGAAKRFLSCEPLLSQINLWPWIDPSDPCVDCDVCGEERFPDEIGRGHVRVGGESWCPGPSLTARARQIDWVIVGGESGARRRDADPGWITDIARQCQAADVPVFVKQDSGPRSGQQGRIPDDIWALKEFPEVAW